MLKRLSSVEPSVQYFNYSNHEVKRQTSLGFHEAGSLTKDLKHSQSKLLVRENKEIMKKLIEAKPSYKFEELYYRSEKYDKLLKSISKYETNGQRKKPLMLQKM